MLTFQGPQGIGKTTFIRSLISDDALRESVVKLDHHLDGADKDTIITAATHWIVEIGELDSSFRKDIARLKGIITADTDKVRLPYHRRDSEFPRRTVFCATVNARHFLVDETGNSRATIPVIAMNYQHGIDMQQLWAQVRSKFESAGFQWWLTPEEEAALEAKNRDHRAGGRDNPRTLGCGARFWCEGVGQALLHGDTSPAEGGHCQPFESSGAAGRRGIAGTLR